MQEKIYTIPVNDAFRSGDECPFCNLERDAEQRAIRYVAGPGASYMEPDVRSVTNRLGFCPHHTKKLYEYGNTLGNALMFQTYFEEVLGEFQAESAKFVIPPKKTLFPRKKQKNNEAEPYWQRLRNKVSSCYVCDKMDYNMERYYMTFFYLVKDPEFQHLVESCNGFCMRHFSKLLELAEDHLPNGQREWFYAAVFKLMKDQLSRVKGDLDWLIAKYDYRNAGADWKNSRDALPRAMQKMEGGYPADPPFKSEP